MFGFGAPGIPEILILLFMFAAVAVITVVPFWLICGKAGFPGWISIFAVIPFCAVILLFFLAFAEWPALQQADQTVGGAGDSSPT